LGDLVFRVLGRGRRKIDAAGDFHEDVAKRQATIGLSEPGLPDLEFLVTGMKRSTSLPK
jgi:hypothetical protein